MPKRARNDTQEVAAAAASAGVPRSGQAGAFTVKAKPAPEQAQLTKPDSVQPELKEPTIAEIFGPGGALAKCMPDGYEHRPSPLEMAETVEAAFRQKRHVIVEAGTGTGKTLAYLIPAIRSGRRVVISTATKSLQEQLFEKDIPFLQKHFARNLKVAVMKGGGDVFCAAKIYKM